MEMKSYIMNISINLKKKKNFIVATICLLMVQMIFSQNNFYIKTPLLSYQNTSLYNDFELGNINKNFEIGYDFDIYIPSFEIGYTKDKFYTSIGYQYFDKWINPYIENVPFPEYTIKSIKYQYLSFKLGYKIIANNSVTIKTGLISTYHLGSNVYYSCNRFRWELFSDVSDFNKFKLGYELSIEKKIYKKVYIGLEGNYFYKHKFRKTECLNYDQYTILNTNLMLGYRF